MDRHLDGAERLDHGDSIDKVEMNIPTHPVQVRDPLGRPPARIPQVVALRSYEVYKHLYGAQPAMVEGQCRGGFGVGEHIVFLYAASFPKSEWEARVNEALTGMVSV